MSRTRIIAIAVAAMGLLSLGGAGWAEAAGSSTPTLPTKDPFYTYTGSTPLSKIADGTVLKKRTVTIVISGSQQPYSAFQLLYRTENELGQPSVTVTTVIKPEVPAASIHLVSYQTFYDALGAQCDPSYTLQGGNPGYGDAQDDAIFMRDYLNAGDYVVDSDYEGEHLDWTAGYESGYNTLDGIRAAESALGAPASTPVGLTGYSGGSIASEWAAELAPGYAPKLNIVGTAIGGIPVDFAHNLDYINGSAGWSGIMPATLVALNRAFHTKLYPYLSPLGRKLAAQAQDACINNFYGSHPGLKVSQLFKPLYKTPLNLPVSVAITNKLIMGTVPGHPQEPFYMVVGDEDGTGDGVMVTADDEALAHEYCSQGMKVQFTIEKGDSHTDAAIPFEANALPYLTERFDGASAPSNCSSIGKGNSLAPLKIPCNFVSGRLHGRTLGAIAIGDTRKRVSKAAAGRTSTRGHHDEQFLCLQPSGMRVVYASARLTGRLPRADRAALRGRVVWASTASTYYSLRGVKPGARLASAARALHLGRPFKLGTNRWYFTHVGGTLAVVRVHGGRVAELGIAARALGRSRALELAFLRSFN